VKKIKILKGVGAQCPAPCKKTDGFLSIEKTNEVNYIVFRNFTGKVLFSGIVNKQAAKIKVLEDENKRKLKFTCVVTDQNKK
jgi:hypothetical protein